ncbi:MAG: hypothetical protein AB8H12_03195 [Lewinella sp.]
MKSPLTFTLAFSIVLWLFTGCADDDTTSPIEVPAGLTDFADSFEGVGTNLDLLFPADNSRWSKFQQVNTAGGNNQAFLVDTSATDGAHALYLFAQPGNDPLSKMDIEKGGFAAVAGQTVRIEADFRINSNENLADMLLLDFECCSCWDPDVPDNKCPGVRLLFSGGNDFLSIERGKIGHETILQQQVAFPRFAWTKVVWEMTLSPEEDGLNVLSINGEEVIRASAKNLPNATDFKEQAAGQGVDFTLQEPVFYERLQVGATAKVRGSDVALLVDNVSVSIRD